MSRDPAKFERTALGLTALTHLKKSTTPASPVVKDIVGSVSWSNNLQKLGKAVSEEQNQSACRGFVVESPVAKL